MSIYCNRFIEKINYASPAAVFLLLFICCFQAYAGQLDIGTRAITIVLDPGHGGEIDSGAKGPDGKLEKDVTLRLAGMIAAGLDNRYNIILTRMEDTELDIPARTAVANHFKADLFISIHAGGGFVNKSRGISLCYFTDNYPEAAGTGIVQGKPVDNPGLPVPWEKIQKQHEQLSGDFANIVKKNLSGIITNGEIRISGANYAVLEGADMPAILIEAGYLTNPAEEESLSGKEYPAGIVKGLSLAVDEFFQNIGLQEKIKRGNDGTVKKSF
jgi:N-acetylmuramoyl-L-alanine amidase